MSRVITDYDPVSGITEQFYQDQSTGKIRIKKTQDTQGLFDHNKDQRNSANSDWKGEFHKVATIPLIVIDIWREELKNMGVADPNPLASCNKAFFIAKLNNRDFMNLRTKKGKI